MQVRTEALEGNKYFPSVGLLGSGFSAVFALHFFTGAHFSMVLVVFLFNSLDS